MDTIFINSENTRTSEYHVLVLKLADELDLRRGHKSVALSNLSIYYTWRNIKSSYNSNKFKISAPTWSDNLNYQMDHTQYQIFKIILSIFLKNIVKVFDNPSIKIYVNKIENRVTFKIIKNGYYLELLTPETMTLLRSTESKITKDANGENVPHLEVVELVLVHRNIINNNYQRDSRILYTFVSNKPFGSLLEISPTNNIFLKAFNSEFQEIKSMVYRSN